MRIKLLFAFLLLSIAAFGQQNPIQIDANGLTQTFGVGGIVSRGQIVKINSSGQVVPVLTTDTSGAIGIAATSQQNVGQVVAVSIAGSPLVLIDSSGCAAGNIVSFSTTAGGSGHCASTAVGQQVGVAISISSPGSNFWNVALSLGGGGGGVSANSPLPAATSGPGPVFNVKNYGAFGNAQMSIHGNSDGTTNIITCSDCAFSTAKDVTSPQKAIFLSNASIAAWTVATIAHIVSVTNATTVVTDTVTNNAIANGTLRWGALDDSAFTAATTAAIAAAHLVLQTNQLGVISSAPTIYMPAGSYLFCSSVGTSVINLAPASQVQQINVIGDGASASNGYVGDSPACPYSTNIPWFLDITNNVNSSNVVGILLDGGENITGKNLAAISSQSNGTYMHDVVVVHSNPAVVGSGSPAIDISNGAIYGDRITVVGNGGPFRCNACQGVIENSVFSNNGGGANSAAVNLQIQTVSGSPFGPGFRIGKGVLVDECGASTGGCTQVVNSQDVWFIGPGIFGTASAPCLNVDATSYVHFNGGLCGLFSTDSNVSGPKVAAGGVLEESDVRNVSSGTGKCLNISGTLLNNGSNTCESLFAIASGSESVNTVSLTLTTQGANVSTNCAIGDTALVEGASPGAPGYNGKYKFAITAVGTNTVSYTNPTSGLGAIGAGGAFSCLHNRSVLLTGVPTQSLAPSQFNCNIPTLTATTTTATTNCFFTPDRDIYVTRFSAGLGTTPATCTTAAILQVTNGTNSTNLTITNAQAQDDSGAITGVLMAAGTKVGVIVQTAASGCGTSPANAAVNFLWMAALDN